MARVPTSWAGDAKRRRGVGCSRNQTLRKDLACAPLAQPHLLMPKTEARCPPATCL